MCWWQRCRGSRVQALSLSLSLTLSLTLTLTLTLVGSAVEGAAYKPDPLTYMIDELVNERKVRAIPRRGGKTFE